MIKGENVTPEINVTRPARKNMYHSVTTETQYSSAKE